MLMTQQEYDNWCYNQNRGCFNPFVMCGLIIVLCLLLSGCRTQYVPVPEYHTEYVYRTDSVTFRDSIYVHDSIYTEKKGDTIFVNKWRTQYVDRYRDVVRIDSFIKTDSIRVPYPCERQATRWERFCIDYGKIMLGATILAVVAAIIFLVLWIRKKARI